MTPFQHLRRICLLLWILSPVAGRSAETEAHFSRRIWNIRPHEYGGDSQVWSIADDRRGCIYIAAGTHLCAWNGYDWEAYATEGKNVIRHLLWDEPTQRLYCTGDNHFGFWERDRYGVLAYHSLYSNDDLSRNQIFWRMAPCDKGFYLQSHEELYLYDDGALELVASGRIGYVFATSDGTYIQIDGTIARIDGRQLTRIAAAPNDRAVFLERSDDGTVTLLTEMSGFFRIDPGSEVPRPIHSEASHFFSDLRVFSACRRSDGGYLVGTVLDGAYLTDAAGNVVEKFTARDGLDYTTVLSLAEGPSGDIILGLDGGVAWIWDNESAKFFTPVSGRIGSIYAAAYWNNDLYVGTNKGLYRIDGNRLPHMLPNTQGQIWNLIPMQHTLAVIADRGLCSLRTDGSFEVVEPSVWKAVPIPGKRGVYCASDKNGLILLQEDHAGNLSVRNRLANYSNPDNSVLFDKYGYIWVEWLRGKVKRLTPDAELTRIKECREYPVGRDPKCEVRAFRIDGEVVFVSGRECYSYMPHLDAIALNAYYTNLFSRFGSPELNIFQHGNAFFNYADNTVDMLIRSGEETRVVRDVFRSSEFEQLPKRFRRLQTLGDSAVVCGFSEVLGMVSIKRVKRDTTPKVYLNGVSYERRGQQRRVALDEPLVVPYAASDLAFDISSNPRSSLEYRIDGGKWEPVDGPVAIKYIESGTHRLEIGYGDHVLMSAAFTAKRHFTTSWWFLLLLAAAIAGLIYAGRRIYRSRMRNLKSKYETRQRELIEKELFQHQNELLSLELRERDKKLSMLALNDITVNNMLDDILDQLDSVTDASNRTTLKPLRRRIEKYKRDNGTWKTFELYFNGIFDGFFDRLRARYPNLTNNDLKICAYVKLGMSTKEIASLMNIELSSAESARYRLRKNMGLAQTDSLTEIVSKI